MFDRLKGIAFLDVPFHSVRIIVNRDVGRLNGYVLAIKLSEDLIEKWGSGKYSRALPLSEEERFSLSLANDVSAIVK